MEALFQRATRKTRQAMPGDTGDNTQESTNQPSNQPMKYSRMEALFERAVSGNHTLHAYTQNKGVSFWFLIELEELLFRRDTMQNG